MLFTLPSSIQVSTGINLQQPVTSLNTLQSVQPISQQTPQTIIHKVSGKNLPNFSFTGDMHSIRKSNTGLDDENNTVSVLSVENMELVRGCWPDLLKRLEDKGKIRLLAALSHSKFDGGTIAVQVANAAIEQEVLESRADIQEAVFDLTGIRVGIRVDVTPDIISVGRPVSDSQRLQAIIKKQPEVKLLCDLLKLKL